jgi:hypothetical protein
MSDLLKIAGGIGCDIVTGTSEFTARKGKIYALRARADNSGITNVKEDQGLASPVTVTSRSYLGTNTLLKDELIIPDYPLTAFTPAAGSFIVYYV